MGLEILLEDTFDLLYVGEGAANVVFRIVRKDEPPVLSRAESVTLSTLPSSGVARPADRLHEYLNTSDDGTLSTREIREHSSTAAFTESGPIPSLYRSDSHESELDTSSEPSSLPLLRLRKDLATVTPVLEAHQNYERMIKPFLEFDSLVKSDLAVLPPALVDRCNDVLLGMEDTGSRPKKRRNTYLAYQPYANLVQDMSARYSSDIIVEFKPKWLAQSPSAPENANRCRTCALRAMRQDKGGESGQALSAFCPLDLVTRDRSSLLHVLTKQLGLTSQLSKRPDSCLKATTGAIADHLLHSGVMEKIKQLQTRMDPQGILGAKVDAEFLMAMTLRDCTMFIRVDQDLKVEARLGDIDLKPVTKSSYWRLIEQRLIDEGWYTCSESSTTGRDPVCALSR